MSFALTHWGRNEVRRFGWPLLVATVGVALAAEGPWKWLAVIPAVLLAWVLSFFRDPPRRIPEEADAVVSPADGTIAEIAELDHYDFLDGPAVRIGIFLSIFNVHINRAPRAARVLETHYREGEYLNALNPASAERNESMWIGLEDLERPGLRMAVRQISGAIARRIVCELETGGGGPARGEVWYDQVRLPHRARPARQLRVDRQGRAEGEGRGDGSRETSRVAACPRRRTSVGMAPAPCLQLTMDH